MSNLRQGYGAYYGHSFDLCVIIDDLEHNIFILRATIPHLGYAILLSALGPRV